MEESLLLRQIPHSVEAEQAVLGSMLIDTRCIPEVIEQLTGEDFYHKTNRAIYETIYAMFSFSKPIDPVTLIDEMKQRGVSIVAITGYKSSGLGMIADCALFFPPLEHYHDKIAAFYSGACTSLILDLLYAACFAHRYDECRRSRALVLEELRDYVPQDFSGQ